MNIHADLWLDRKNAVRVKPTYWSPASSSSHTDGSPTGERNTKNSSSLSTMRDRSIARRRRSPSPPNRASSTDHAADLRRPNRRRLPFAQFVRTSNIALREGGVGRCLPAGNRSDNSAKRLDATTRLCWAPQLGRARTAACGRENPMGRLTLRVIRSRLQQQADTLDRRAQIYRPSSSPTSAPERRQTATDRFPNSCLRSFYSLL
uniref:Uncharacterized protein n=1 Tax=Plectus sambesii TaxID=2011161 RepID=A0A914V6P9_9BILA